MNATCARCGGPIMKRPYGPCRAMIMTSAGMLECGAERGVVDGAPEHQYEPGFDHLSTSGRGVCMCGHRRHGSICRFCDAHPKQFWFAEHEYRNGRVTLDHEPVERVPA